MNRLKSTHARGYGNGHQKLRQRLVPVIAAGGVKCARCGLEIRPGQAWHLDHDDFDRRRYLGVSHAVCNLEAGGVKANRGLVDPGLRSRDW